jgi:hypothetical protein
VERREFFNQFNQNNRVFELIAERVQNPAAQIFLKNFSKKNIKIILFLVERK